MSKCKFRFLRKCSIFPEGKFVKRKHHTFHRENYIVWRRSWRDMAALAGTALQFQSAPENCLYAVGGCHVPQLDDPRSRWAPWRHIVWLEGDGAARKHHYITHKRVHKQTHTVSVSLSLVYHSPGRSGGAARQRRVRRPVG